MFGLITLVEIGSGFLWIVFSQQGEQTISGTLPIYALNSRNLTTVKFQVFLFTFIVLALFSPEVLAQSAEASLSVQQAMVGQPVVLTVRLENAPGAKIPQNLSVDGLDIRFRSQSQQVSMVNLNYSITVIYTYLVVPQRAGAFTIPSISIPTKGGDRLTTQPLQLIVSDRFSAAPATAKQPQPAPGTSAAPSFRTQKQAEPNPEDVVSIQLSFPKGKVYVGQMIPIEMRVFFDARYQYQVDQMPLLAGDGYIVEKLSKPAERQQIINDVPYAVLAFDTAVTPIKQGQVEIQPATFKCAVLISQPLPDIFADLFGNALSGSGGTFGDYKEIQAKSNGTTLDVLPLPSAGRPNSFSGAIGRFSMTATASPKNAGPGEPVTMKIQIRGQGNFNSITAPQLTNTDGWRVYPATDTFLAEDYTGFSGTKSFEIAMVATEDKRSTPKVEFSYFDPVEAKYQTLTASEIPITAAGNPAAKAGTQMAGGEGASKMESAGSEMAHEPSSDTDRAQIMTALSLVSPVPMPFRFGFLLANSFAFIVFLGWLVFCGVRAFYQSPRARELRMKRAQANVLAEIERPGLLESELYGYAAEFARLEGMMRSSRSVEVTPRTIVAQLNPELQKPLLEILEKAEEVKYGAEHHNAPATPEQRNEVVKLLRDIALQKKAARGGKFFLFVMMMAMMPMAHAADANLEVWQTANQAFSDGRLDEAARGYQLLLDKGISSPALEYNMALIEKRRGNIATAVLELLRARALAPSNQQIADELSQLSKEYPVSVPQPRLENRIAAVVGLSSLWIGGMIIWWAGAFLIVFGVFVARHKWRWISVSVLVLILGKVILLIAWQADPLLSERKLWVVNTKETAYLKAMPVDNAEVLSEVHSGSAVRVLSRRGNWIYCALPDGIKGWMPVDSATPIVK